MLIKDKYKIADSYWRTAIKMNKHWNIIRYSCKNCKKCYNCIQFESIYTEYKRKREEYFDSGIDKHILETVIDTYK